MTRDEVAADDQLVEDLRQVALLEERLEVLRGLDPDREDT